MKIYFSNYDFFNSLVNLKNDEGVYLVDDIYHSYIEKKFNDYQKLIESPKLFFDVINTICEQYNVASFHFEDDYYLKVNDLELLLLNEIKVFSTDGDRINLFIKKEKVKGNINNKLRKIIINNRLFYYLDVKSFKSNLFSTKACLSFFILRYNFI